MSSRPTLIGAHVTRVEDERLLAGRGRYAADLKIPGMLEVAFVRSPFAHATVGPVDAEDAMAVDGVIGVYTAADLEDVEPFPDFDPYARPVRIFPLARDRVRFVGAPIAAVVATSRYAAEDGRDRVFPELDPLPVLVDVGAALDPDAVRLFADWPDNLVVDAPVDYPPAHTAFEGAAVVVSGRYEVGRHSGVPMETRGVTAEFRDGKLTVWSSTQFPHIARTMLSYCLPIAEDDIRVIAPDVGGGFGVKAEFYPEEVMIPWLAMKLGRPVRWIEDRREHMMSAGQARDLVLDLEAALDDTGRFLAIRGTAIQNMGSGEMYPYGYSPAFTAIGHITGPYRIPHQSVGLKAVVTNKTPAGAYRGFGIPEAVFATERLMDKAARTLGMTRDEIRRRNLIDAADLPYTTASGAVLDSGSHREAFEATQAEMEARLEHWRSVNAHDPDLRIGAGLINYVEGVTPSYFLTTANWGAFDSCAIRINPDGTAVVSLGVSAFGQGLESMLLTVAAETLGMKREDIRIVMGDTDRAPYGLGSWGSRGTNVSTGALLEAAVPLLDKGRKIAAHLLEAAEEDLELFDGGFNVRGSPDAAISWQRIATVANLRTMHLPDGVAPGTESVATYDPPGLEHAADEHGRVNASATYTNSSHAAIVAVDITTGVVRVLEYIIAHDCGTVINPQIVRGQATGGAAQGIGGALYEEFHYDEEGNPLSTSFLDYHMPTAMEIPQFNLLHFETPAPNMPFGAKGAGEAGIVGPAPAIAAAVEDALGEYGIGEIDRTPITPEYVLGLLDAAAGPS